MKKRIQKWLSIIVLFLTITSQSNHAYAFDFKTALPQSLKIPISQKAQFTEIYDIETDSTGYIYLATNAGIYKFNGFEIVPICEESHPTDYLHFIKSNDGSLYAMPYENKILKINTNAANQLTIKILPLPNSSQNYRAYYGYEDSLKQMHFLVKTNHHTISSFKYITGNKTLLLENNFQIALNDKQDANPFFKQMQEQLGIHDTAFQQLQEQIHLQNKSIRSHQIVILNHQIFQLKNNTKKLIYSALPNSHFITRYYQSINKNAIYVSEKNETQSVYKITATQKQLLFTNREITGICEDHWGNLFIATRTDGLFKINHEDFFTNNFSIQHTNPIVACHYASPSQIFVADEVGNLFVVNLINATFQPILTTKNKQYIPPVFNKINNTIFYANAEGIYEITPQNTTSKISISFLNATVLKKIISIHNTQFFISKRRIAFIKNNKLQEFLPPNNVTSADSFQNNIVLATYKGISYFNPNDTTFNLKSLKTNTDADEGIVKQVVSHHNNIYFQHNDAIYVYNGATKKSNLLIPPTNERFEFFYLFQDYLMVIKEKAFCIFNTNGKLIRKYFLPIQTSENDKIVTSSLSFPNLLLIHKNNANIYDLNQIKQIPKQLQIVPTTFIYNNDTNLSIIPVTFHKNATLQIAFDFLNAQENDIFELQIFNLDNELINRKILSKNNSFSLFNLEPNEYHASIYCLNKTYYNFTFTILPAWYQTAWFKFLCIFFAILFLVLFYFFLLKRKEKIYQAHNLVLRLESQSKTNQLKSHFIFNALTPIQNYILKNKNKEAADYLQNFSKLMRNILKMNHKVIISVSEEIEFIQQYLHLQQIEKNHQFEFQIITNLITRDPNHLFIPTLIIQPIVENAINYGMSYDNNQKGFISVQFNENISHNLLEVNIFDNGNGFSKVNYSDGKINLHALEIIQKRLAILQKNEQKGFNPISFTKVKNGFNVKINIPLNEK